MKTKKRVLIVTQYFYPEEFKVNDIAFDLVRDGVEVTVLTAIPNYPYGRFFKGYGLFSKRKEILNGVNVIRVPVIPRGKGGGMQLIMNYLSFVICSFIPALKLAYSIEFDSVFVHEVSPVTVGIPAVIIKKIQKIPLYFWVLDLWPETMSAITGLTHDFFISPLTKLVKWIYNNSDKILISSRGFEQAILNKGIPKEKLMYFPNWAEALFESSTIIEELPQLPEGFKIMYAGNVGDAQNLELIMHAAKQLKNHNNIKWVIIGDGRKLPWVREYVDKHHLADRVFLMGRYPMKLMPSFYSKADVMLLSLKASPIFELTVPARIQTYMACAKPILGLISGEASYLIHDAQCGYVAKSEDLESFVGNVLKMESLSLKERKCMGDNAALYYNRNFQKELQLRRLKELLFGEK